MPNCRAGVRMSPTMASVRSLLVAVLVCTASGVRAQEAARSTPDGNAAAVEKPPDTPADRRTQYPKFMENSFFTFSVGAIGYRFNQRQLEPGFQAESVDRPGLAVRVDLFGHHITKNLSVPGHLHAAGPIRGLQQHQRQWRRPVRCRRPTPALTLVWRCR